MTDPVSKAVQDYEAEQQRQAESVEAQEVRALVQGMLAGAMMQQAAVGALGIKDVEIDVDENGNYLDYFYVVMRSGIRVRVDVGLDA